MPIATELPINTAATALDMANEIFGSGVTVVSATYSGDPLSSGTYSNGLVVSPGVVPADTGVILSTGFVADFTNDSGTTNTNISASTGSNSSGINGDADFDALAGRRTFDAAILEAVFVPDGDQITVDFVIASDEYPEFVNSEFLDTVGVWVNGVEATVSIGNGDASVGNINSSSAPNLYNDNTGDQFNTEMDGFTVTLTFVAPVNPGVANTIKIGVADVSDPNYDTNLLIAGGSVQSTIVAQDDQVNAGLNSTKTLAVLDNDSTTGGTLTITKINGISVNPGDSVTLTSGQVVTLNADGTLTVDTDADVETVYFNYTVSNGLGNEDTAIVQVTQMPCFVAGTLIDTPKGPVPVETIKAGDLVMTLDDGPQPVQWAGARETAAQGDFAPIRISAGTFGASADIWLSPQHRVLISDYWADLLFGEPEVLIKAKDLVNGTTVQRVPTGTPVTYVHLLFDRHQIVRSSGLASESYLPGPMMSKSFDAEAQAEIVALFPELADVTNRAWPSVRPILKSHEARTLLARAA
ncbi:Hint domain-containing protein [Marivita hallyeonensis]|uniref:Hint domain-containing protein n=1 Tax=Marivita hallyeonensis TaxID=996342 RepID=A0A1M5QIT2_9RHOB|nr:Hint domain-containing protein [Marivita hallyeonensis]SHH13838.1 Hint domain-containing protein [Marivita hallyeonensis]